MNVRTTLSLALGASLVVGGALAPSAVAAPTTPPPVAAAADDPLTSATGISVVDVDGGTITAPTPSVIWTQGAPLDGALAAYDSKDVPGIKVGYDVRVTGTTTRAGVTGANVAVAEAVLTLRGRVPVTVTNLEAGVGPDGRSFVSFDRLTVGDVDLTDQAQSTPGFTYAVPNDGPYAAATVLTVGAVTRSGGTTRVTALALTDSTESYEVSALRLGEVSSTAFAQPHLEPARVVGVQVFDPSTSARYVEPAPVLTRPGAATASADAVTANAVRSRANGVTVSTDDDGSEHVHVDSFQQTPRDGTWAEYYPSALRVNGLELDVAPDGSSNVTFDDPSNALFADGRWLSALNGSIYTALDADQSPTLEVYVNERTQNDDGTVTINALRYVDLTGTWPSVILGQVTTGVDDGSSPGPGPGPGVEQPDLTGVWHAFGLQAEGASPLAPTPLVTRSSPTGDVSQHVTQVGDGLTGQLVATDVSVAIAGRSASASVGSLSLFPGTDAAVTVTNLRTTVQEGRVTVSSDGGTVLGRPLAAGTIAPNTALSLPGGARVTLASVTTDPTGLVVASGLVLDDGAGLGSTVVVARAAASTTPSPAATGTTTRVTLSSAKRAYGKVTKAKVQIAAPGARAVSGVVTLRDGSRTLGSALLSVVGGAATHTFTLPTTLTVASHRIAATFVPGPGELRSSTSPVAVLTVTKAKAKVRTTVKRSVKRGARPRATVRVTGVKGGAAVTGKVRVVVRGKVVRTVTLRARAHGKVVVRLPRLRKTARVKALYVGSTTYRKVSSSPSLVRVR